MTKKEANVKLLHRVSVLEKTSEILQNPRVSEILKSTIFKPELKIMLDEVSKNNNDLQLFLNSSVFRGTHRALIMSGPPGIGKTHATITALELAGMKNNVNYVICRGQTTALALYQQLYLMRNPGCFVIIEDCDGLLGNDIALNILKGACDPKFNNLSWNTSRAGQLTHSTGPNSWQTIPTEFQFNGSVIITTNVSFDHLRKGKIADHWNALKDRCVLWTIPSGDILYQYARIFYMVTKGNLLNNDEKTQLTLAQEQDLLEFLFSKLPYANRFSLRTAQTVAREMKCNPNNWKKLANIIVANQ